MPQGQVIRSIMFHAHSCQLFHGFIEGGPASSLPITLQSGHMQPAPPTLSHSTEHVGASVPRAELGALGTSEVESDCA
eukprot:1438562-Amphidinium_carterae.2